MIRICIRFVWQLWSIPLNDWAFGRRKIHPLDSLKAILKKKRYIVFYRHFRNFILPLNVFDTCDFFVQMFISTPVSKAGLFNWKYPPKFSRKKITRKDSDCWNQYFSTTGGFAGLGGCWLVVQTVALMQAVASCHFEQQKWKDNETSCSWVTFNSFSHHNDLCQGGFFLFWTYIVVCVSDKTDCCQHLMSPDSRFNTWFVFRLYAC